MDEGESEIENAVREVREEVYLNLLDKNNFAYVGRFPQNIPFFYKGKDARIYVQPLMFIQTSFETPEIKLQQAEVANHVWTNLQFLALNDQRFFHLREQDRDFFGSKRTI